MHHGLNKLTHKLIITVIYNIDQPNNVTRRVIRTMNKLEVVRTSSLPSLILQVGKTGLRDYTPL